MQAQLYQPQGTFTLVPDPSSAHMRRTHIVKSPVPLQRVSWRLPISVICSRSRHCLGLSPVLFNWLIVN